MAYLVRETLEAKGRGNTIYWIHFGSFFVFYKVKSKKKYIKFRSPKFTIFIFYMYFQRLLRMTLHDTTPVGKKC